MKIIKPGTLTVFSALILAASHGVHAMPREEGLFTPINTNPKLSPPKIDKVSHTSAIATHKEQIWMMEEEEKIEEEKEGEPFKRKAPLPTVKLKKSKMADVKSKLMEGIDELLESKNFSERLNGVPFLIKKLRNTINEKDFSKKALEFMLNAIEYLGKVSKSDRKTIHSLQSAINSLDNAMLENAPENELMNLKECLESLTKKRILSMANEVEHIIKEKNIDSMEDLQAPFANFVCDVTRLEDKNSHNGKKSLKAISRLRDAMRADDQEENEKESQEGVLENLRETISELGDIDVEHGKSLKKNADAVKKFLLEILKKMAHLLAQTTWETLEANPLTANLAEPFLVFADAMQWDEFRGDDATRVGNFLDVLDKVDCVAKERDLGKLHSNLGKAILCLDGVRHESLQAPAIVLMESLKDSLKGALPQAAHEVAKSLEANISTMIIAEPFRDFIGAVLWGEDVSLDNVKKSLRLMRRLQRAADGKSEEDIISSLERTIKKLHDEEDDSLKTLGSNLKRAMKKALLAVKGSSFYCENADDDCEVKPRKKQMTRKDVPFASKGSAKIQNFFALVAEKDDFNESLSQETDVKKYVIGAMDTILNSKHFLKTFTRFPEPMGALKGAIEGNALSEKALIYIKNAMTHLGSLTEVKGPMYIFPVLYACAHSLGEALEYVTKKTSDQNHIATSSLNNFIGALKGSLRKVLPYALNALKKNPILESLTAPLDDFKEAIENVRNEDPDFFSALGLISDLGEAFDTGSVDFVPGRVIASKLMNAAKFPNEVINSPLKERSEALGEAIGEVAKRMIRA